MDALSTRISKEPKAMGGVDGVGLIIPQMELFVLEGVKKRGDLDLALQRLGKRWKVCTFLDISF